MSKEAAVSPELLMTRLVEANGRIAWLEARNEKLEAWARATRYILANNAVEGDDTSAGLAKAMTEWPISFR